MYGTKEYRQGENDFGQDCLAESHWYTCILRL
jgi:hypothetical protein